jgi:Flp pilus assembly pilin Flp
VKRTRPEIKNGGILVNKAFIALKRRGQALSEYAVILFLVVVSAIVALAVFGNQISQTLDRVRSSIGG